MIKVKKFLTVFMTAVLIATAVPATVSASSTNSMERNVAVMPDTCFSNTFQMVMDGPVNTPGKQKFSLEIDNGEFAKFTANGSREDNNLSYDPTALTYGLYNAVPKSAEDEFISNVTNASINNTSVVFAFFHDGAEATNDYLELASVRLKKDSAKISVTLKKNLVEKDTMLIYLNMKAGSDGGGAVALRFDGEDSIFSGANQNIGNVVVDRTKAKVNGNVESYGRGNNVKSARVEIEELSSNSVSGNQVLRFTLPKGIEWSDATVFGGSMLESAVRGKSLKEAWRMDGDYDDLGEYSIKGNVLYINMKYDGSSLSRDSLYIEPVFDIGKDAERGGIRLEIKVVKADGNRIDDVVSGEVGTVKLDPVKDNKPTQPADTKTGKTKAVFKIGEAKYSLDKNDVTMDGAPFIDANNRTMLPIRYVANALKVSDDGISYNNATRTATIVKASSKTKVKITTGEKMIAVSKNDGTLQQADGVIPMDTVAVNRGGRIYVPARYIAEAFEAEVVWNQSDKTIEISYK